MAFYRTYECPSCTGRFRWLHHPSDSPPPSNCPICGVSTEAPEQVFNPEAPSIKGRVAPAADQVYRAMEESSAARAQMMADLGGGSASDYAHTKITDLKDNTREGETHFKMPPNEVRGFMEAHPQATVGSQAAAVAQQYAAQAHTGYMPHAGSRTSSVVKNVHHQMVNRMETLGRMNK